MVCTGAERANGGCAAGESRESTEPFITAQTTRGAPEASAGNLTSTEGFTFVLFCRLEFASMQ